MRATFDPFGLIPQQVNKLDGKVDELRKAITEPRALTEKEIAQVREENRQQEASLRKEKNTQNFLTRS